MIDRRYTLRALVVAAALLLSSAPFGWASSAPDATCDLQASQMMTAGLAGAQSDGVTRVYEDIPVACQGEAFTLVGSNPGDDFDICFLDGSGNEIECSTASGDEAGEIPQGTVEGEITYWAGVAGTYTLTAPTGGLGGDPATGPVDLYLRTGPTGAGNADTFTGDRTMTDEAPTKPTPSAWHGPWGLSGTAVDPNWVWAPEDGFQLQNAPAEVTFYFTAAGDQALRGADWEITLSADGDALTTVETETDTFLPGEVVAFTVPLGTVSATGSELSLTIDVIFLNEAATAILYDSVDTPSHLSIGPNVEDTTPPAKVEGLAASARDATTISLGWQAATDDVGVDHYVVHRGTSSSPLQPVTTTEATSLLDEGLDPSTTYHYRVQAVDAAGNEGPLSDPVAEATLEEGETNVEPRAITVVAVLDSGFSPYHFDFVGHQHPWNRDADPDNDIRFDVPPSSYIEGHPGATPIELTIPTSPNEDVDALESADADAWANVEASSAGDVNLYWFPGTKIVGAATFGGGFVASPDAHGSRSAATAAGNWHGTCAECVFVLVQGFGGAALEWAAEQDWIDVVTNSYGHSTIPIVRDNVYFGSDDEKTREAVEDGQTIVFSAGNGAANAFVAPMHTYTTNQKGPDWIVTVGAVSPSSKQTYSGAGKPVDISSIGSSYPSSGGSSVNGTGSHSGTSNAAPATAGMIAQVLQDARELLGDTTPGHEAGVVAEGEPVDCGSANPDCALGDGVLTRDELEDLVFLNVQPDEGLSCCATTWPNAYNHYHQGHGVVVGKIDGSGPYQDQLDQMLADATGDATHLERPDGEQEWMVVDSKCRQKMWGSWTGGYYDGTEPELDPIENPLATAYNTWCSQLGDGTLG